MVVRYFAPTGSAFIAVAFFARSSCFGVRPLISAVSRAWSMPLLMGVTTSMIFCKTLICDIVASVLTEHVQSFPETVVSRSSGHVSDGDVGSTLVRTEDLDLDRLTAADRWARRRAHVLAQNLVKG